MVNYKRNAAAKIEKLLALFPCVAIIGARQIGKTTIAKQLGRGWHYVDLEKPSDLHMIHQDGELYLKQFPDKVIFAEAQNWPQLFDILRGVIDEKRDQKGRFIITGSSSPLLLSSISQSLAGRVGIVELGTLKVNEANEMPMSDFYQLFTHELDKDLLPKGEPLLSREQITRHWLKGGYPEPMTFDDESHALWMQNYIDTYVNRDIASLFPKLNRTKYHTFVTMLSKLSGTILNRSDLGRALEINESTAREYLRVADMTFIWRELLSYESNVIKSTVKMPRGHFRDSGLLHALMGVLTMNKLLRDSIIGRSFESFVIEEVLKALNAMTLTGWHAYYYRTRACAEVDLVLTGPFGTLPIEIKHGVTTKLSTLGSLEMFIDKHQLPFGLVINQARQAMWLSDRIYQLPVGFI